MIKIYIVDDHALFAEGLVSMFEKQKDIKVSGFSLNGDEAIRKVNPENTDVVLLDVNMPGMDGISTCKQIKKLHPEINIIAVSMYSEASIISSMVESGASGYPQKCKNRRGCKGNITSELRKRIL